MPGRVRYYRRSSPKVRNGRVQKKNRTEPTPNYYNTYMQDLVIDRERPGPDFKHLLRKKDVLAFIECLPQWDELSKDLDAIVLARGDYETMGWHASGVVAVCAWERAIFIEDLEPIFVQDHQALLDKLQVPAEKTGKLYRLDFDEYTARAFQLVHVLVHELGHHHDQMTTQSQATAARGEGFAESYAIKYEDQMLDAYHRLFS